MIPYVASNSHSFGFSLPGQVITQRGLREASIVNSAGKAIPPTTAATAAALAEADTANLLAVWGYTSALSPYWDSSCNG
jgi:hypothetical protein